MQATASAQSLESRPLTGASSAATKSGFGGADGGKGKYAASGTRSMFGKQTHSHKSSAPAFGFGSAPSRLTFTGAAARGDQTLQASVSSGGAVSPGPIYNPSPASKWFGDAPTIKFGTEEQRPTTGAAGLDISKITGKSMLPGPGSYPLPAAIGSQPLARCNSLPKYSFGNQKQRANPANASCSPGPVYEPKGTRIGAMDRPKYSFSNDIRGKNPGGLRTPGPGAYTYNPALGTQVNSPYRTGMQMGFGTPSKGGRMVLPLEGRASPGPIYMNAGGLRKQAISDRRTAAVVAFTRADRFNGPGSEAAAMNNDGPGPGEYIV